MYSSASGFVGWVRHPVTSPGPTTCCGLGTRTFHRFGKKTNHKQDSYMMLLPQHLFLLSPAQGAYDGYHQHTIIRAGASIAIATTATIDSCCRRALFTWFLLLPPPTHKCNTYYHYCHNVTLILLSMLLLHLLSILLLQHPISYQLSVSNFLVIEFILHHACSLSYLLPYLSYSYSS